MIAGIGTDLIELKRMESALEKYGKRFLDHVFTESEQAAAPTANGKAAYFAARWAVKEAVSKVLATGIGASCGWKDIEVKKNEAGAPFVTLSGAAAETATAKNISGIHVSISHEHSHALAFAVGEK